jgi:hypothetical protein
MIFGGLAMKVILEFNLPDEKEDLESAQDGWLYRAVLYDFSEYLRRKYKHTDPKSKARQMEYNEICEAFWDTLRNSGVELW